MEEPYNDAATADAHITNNGSSETHADSIYKGAIVLSEQLVSPIYTLNKGAIDFSEHNSQQRLNNEVCQVHAVLVNLPKKRCCS